MNLFFGRSLTSQVDYAIEPKAEPDRFETTSRIVNRLPDSSSNVNCSRKYMCNDFYIDMSKELRDKS